MAQHALHACCQIQERNVHLSGCLLPLQDIAIARPTYLYLIPRISKVLYDQFEEEAAKASADGSKGTASKQARPPSVELHTISSCWKHSAWHETS